MQSKRYHGIIRMERDSEDNDNALQWTRSSSCNSSAYSATYSVANHMFKEAFWSGK